MDKTAMQEVIEAYNELGPEFEFWFNKNKDHILAIEKQQIIEAWQEGHHGIYGSVTGESYYNSKYKTL